MHAHFPCRRSECLARKFVVFGSALDLKAHQVETLAGLLARYEATEKLFGGSIEARVLTLREQNKDNLDKVAALVLSHIMAQRKGRLVMTILEHVKTSGLTVTDPNSRIYQVLQGLAALEARRVVLHSLLPFIC